MWEKRKLYWTSYIVENNNLRLYARASERLINMHIFKYQKVKFLYELLLIVSAISTIGFPAHFRHLCIQFHKFSIQLRPDPANTKRFHNVTCWLYRISLCSDHRERSNTVWMTFTFWHREWKLQINVPSTFLNNIKITYICQIVNVQILFHNVTCWLGFRYVHRERSNSVWMTKEV